jgi:hypothetical protein
MFHQVRIFDSGMNLKKIIGSQELEHMYWNTFYEQENNRTFKNSCNKTVSKNMQKELASLFQDPTQNSKC